jgi:hypothetical protein
MYWAQISRELQSHHAFPFPHQRIFFAYTAEYSELETQAVNKERKVYLETKATTVAEAGSAPKLSERKKGTGNKVRNREEQAKESGDRRYFAACGMRHERLADLEKRTLLNLPDWLCLTHYHWGSPERFHRRATEPLSTR